MANEYISNKKQLQTVFNLNFSNPEKQTIDYFDIGSANIDLSHAWKQFIFLQHPLSTNPHLHNIIHGDMEEKCATTHEPLVLVGLEVSQTWRTTNKTTNEQVPYYRSLIINQKSILNVSCVLKHQSNIAVKNTAAAIEPINKNEGKEKKSEATSMPYLNSVIENKKSRKTNATSNAFLSNSKLNVTGNAIARMKLQKEEYFITTSHGRIFVPKIFHNQPLYIGGDSTSTTEILTTSRVCKGKPILNGRWFWNPDLVTAQRMINAGFATVEDFKFFQGCMKWSEPLWNTIKDENMFAAFVLRKTSEKNSMQEFLKMLWIDNHRNESVVDNNIMQSLDLYFDSDSKDEEEDGNLWLKILQEHTGCSFDQSWAQMYSMLKYLPSSKYLSQQMTQLKMRNIDEITEQIKYHAHQN